jgi:hypothetical protein
VQQEQVEGAEHAGRDGEGGGFQVVRQADQVEHLLNEDDSGEGRAERQRQEEGKPPARACAEGQGTGPLQPAQVELAAAVHPRGPVPQFPVGAEERVAAQELARAGQVGKFELVARQGVAQVAHVQEAAFGDPVEQLLDELVAGDALGEVLGQQADPAEGVPEQRPKAPAQPALGPVQGAVQQAGQLLPLGLGGPDRRQPAHGAAEVPGRQHQGLVGQRPHEGPAEGGVRPPDEVR